VPSKNLTFNREVAPSQAPAIATEDQKEKQEFNSPAVGVDKLAKEIGIRVDQTTKTMLYENEKGEIIAAAVRGGYAIDEEKLKKISGSESITLANAEAVEKAGTVIGFVGAHGLAPGVKVYWDESTANRTNFEIGGNKKDLHLYNVNWGRDIEEPKEFYDFKVAQQGDIYPETGETYEVFKAAEVGNIFPLETKFSKAFGYNFIDENNQPGIVYMGSYGIGPSRIMGVLVEKFHDDKGIVWPEAVAPFTVHLLGFNLDDEAVMKRATEIYNFLTEKGIDVLFDDRNKGPGEKFADSDLIGIPHRIVVSKKTGEQVEYKPRNSANALMVSLDEAVDMIQSK
jgi:prolyl-tRNA synthetase